MRPAPRLSVAASSPPSSSPRSAPGTTTSRQPLATTKNAAAVAALDQLHAALDDALADVDRAEFSPRNADRIVATGEEKE